MKYCHRTGILFVTGQYDREVRGPAWPVKFQLFFAPVQIITNAYLYREMGLC
ncbi:hypothetical protein HMPREF0541_02865 [Lacticaseibacillus rhamnosus ATCC 21052]|nr:hypothetical protein HMPREF0541_02865 [Lacticaseibacillus rhamnosus ATCC 21052]